MLATTGALPRGEDWAYEVKWDGVRALVLVESGTASATSRNGNQILGAYPELQFDLPDCVIDGEIVALVDGKPDFGALQNRMHVRSPRPELVASTPVTFLPFDVLHARDSSLLALSYDERRAVLAELLPEAPAPFFGDGALLLDLTRQQGLEGLVAKRRDSTYTPGRRTESWIKVKHVRRQSVVVCGWKEGEGGRSGQLGSLVLGVQSPSGLVYAGHVGTGFTAATMRTLKARLSALASDRCPFDEVPERAHWVRPELVVDVDYAHWTKDGRLRHPSYKGIRDDLDADEVTRDAE